MKKLTSSYSTLVKNGFDEVNNEDVVAAVSRD